ncbi:MAG: peptidase M15 [Gammaproteobacteria bacterium CG22_combo_CG10-13_8_21_14_all_40_8]|nr:MAG: peptidase M15 [Gammaproteobacteria bacterium CG22_combo_CG10-13_8_21_14_all_40_8]
MMDLPEITKELLLGLDETIMIPFSHPNAWVSPGFKIHPAIQEPLSALCDEAYQTGNKLALLSGYRSYHRQKAIWQVKIKGERAIYDANQNPIQSFLDEEEKFSAILKWSALPGSSRHHWGTDIDIFDATCIEQGYNPQLLPDEFSSHGQCAKLNLWLEKNLSAYQFFRPYLVDKGGVAVEPWHISYHPLAQQFSQKLTAEILASAWHNEPQNWSLWALKNIDRLYQKYVLNK